LQQLAAGLAAAHKNGVIHCDLKPSNILVNDQGQLKITDFGIALLAPTENEEKSDAELADMSEAIQYGSLLYMSPEQIQQKVVDYRTDIFSFGILAYQLIVGTHPFTYNNNAGSATDVAKRICDHTPEHAKNLMLNAPSVLTDLLMEMLLKPLEQRTLTASSIENRLQHVRSALMQAVISEEETVPLGSNLPDLTSTLPLSNTLPLNATQAIGREQYTQAFQPQENPSPKWFQKPTNKFASLGLVLLVVILAVWFYSKPEAEAKQVVILKPTLTDSSIIAPMQKDLVISAVEDALRQAVINTKDMYLISQREVNAISKEYPDDLNKLRQATGASDIISTALECDNSRCKVNFSRLVVKGNNSATFERLMVKAEKNWLSPIDKFNAIFSTSQTQFASLFPEHGEVNQSALVQKPINEADYREYIELYNEVKGNGNYSDESLTKLTGLLNRSPYLYAAYGLFRETSLNLYKHSRDKNYLEQLKLVLQNSPPEYRYSVYHAIDSFWLSSDRGDMVTARLKISEAKRKGADDLTILGFEAFMFFSSGQYKEAAESYANAFKLRPSATLLNNIAFSYWRLGDLAKAESALNEMLSIVPNNYRAIRLQANIWLLQGKLELAISAFKKIVTSLNSGTDLTNLSLAYGLNKQYDESLEFARKALKQSPKHPVKLLNLADIEMILGKKSDAFFHYQQVVTILAEKDEVKYLAYLAQAYGQLNKASLAVDALNKAQILSPENGEVSYASAIVYSLLKEKVSAVHHTKAALKNNVGVVWFNLPWFDDLCTEQEFQQLMANYDNANRCTN
jgi:serine/threonine-protein kinase